MPPISVAVIDVETPGNIGTIARAMKNFGFEDLLLVNPPELDPNGEAYGMAGHARTDVLPNAIPVKFDTITEQYITVGFTAYPGQSDARHIRYPFFTPRELTSELATYTEPVAIIFGRESTGLTNHELESIDIICSIPATNEYPVLNLGQAATIALYELRSLANATKQHPDSQPRAAPEDLEAFYEHFDETLHALDYPEEKHEKTMRLLRRLIGRANPTERELLTLRGVLRTATNQSD